MDSPAINQTKIIQSKTNLGRFAGGPTAGGKPEPMASDTEEVAFDFSAYDELVSSMSAPSDLTGSVTTNSYIKLQACFIPRKCLLTSYVKRRCENVKSDDSYVIYRAIRSLLWLLL
jgi:hypothetical protein